MNALDITSIVRNGAARNSDAVAVIFADTAQTYGQLYERSCRLANILKSLGVNPGERVATLSENCVESVELIAGLALGGYVRSALYTYNAAESNVYLLNLVGASTLILHADLYPALAPHLGDVAGLRHIIVFGGPTPDGAIRYESALAAASAQDPALDIAEDAPHLIRFSSGTTGKPKGIMHTVAGWRAVATEIALCLPKLTETDRYLAAGPLARLPRMGLDGLCADLDCRREDADAAVQLLRSLDPRPGSRYGELPPGTYVTPDCVIWRQQGMWRVALSRRA